MFIIKLLFQHVSGIIMPIIRRTRVCTAAYFVLHCLSNINLNSAHSSRPSATQPQSSQPVQNTICGSTHSCSPDDGHNDARNMLKQKFDNKHKISCILLVSLSSPYVPDARSQEPKKYFIGVHRCLYFLASEGFWMSNNV